MPKFLFDFKKEFPSVRFIFNEVFQPRSAETQGENIDSPPPEPLSAERHAELEAEQSERLQERTENDAATARERAEFEEGFDEELDAAYGSTTSGIEVMSSTEMTEAVEQREQRTRVERQTQELNESFIGSHVISDLPEVNAGRTLPRTPDDNWLETGGKGVWNTLSAITGKALYAGEELVRFGGGILGGVADGAKSLWNNTGEALGKAWDWTTSITWEGVKKGTSDFFSNWWEDTKASWENSEVEGKIATAVVLSVDALGGSKGLGKLSKLEDLMKKAEDLVPFDSPDFARRTEALRNHLDEVSPGNIRRIEEETIRDGVDRGWFTEAEFKEVLEQEHRQLLERFERGEVRLTNNFEEDKLDDIFGSGGIKTKYELDDPGWVMAGKFNERLKRARIETDMKVEGLNPKYAGFDGGTDKWGDFEMVLDPTALQDRLSFTHLDSFNAGVGRNNPSSGQLNIEGALRSRAILSAERRLLEKKFETYKDKDVQIFKALKERYPDPSNVYTETQVLGPMRLGHEIKEIIVPESARPKVEKTLEKYPEYRRFITYK